MTESTVQLLAEGTGPKVRTVTVTEPIAAATTDLPDVPTATRMQVVTLADADGTLVGLGDLRGSISDLTAAVVRLTELVTFLTE